MSNETVAEQEQELKDLEQQITQLAETEKAKAAETPSPEPEVSPAPEAEKVEEAPVTQSEADSQPTEKPKDDPLEWAKKKGFKSPEDMARALLQKEQEFHQSRQQREQAQPQVQQWQPRPDMGYGYQQPQYAPPPPRLNARDIAPYYPNLAPEDVERVLPLVVDAVQAISGRQRAEMEQKFGVIQRQTERNNELMTLMQDPAFRDERVQKEVHAILDSDPTIFQRERTPLAYAYKEAVFNMGRKQLQQGVTREMDSVRPPVTAGGGNGSNFTTPKKITEADFDRWSLKDQEAFIRSNGKVLPKK